MMCFYCWLLQGSVTVCFQVSLVQLAIVRGLSDVDVILTPSGFQPYTRTYQCYLDIVGKQIPLGHPMYLRILGCRYMSVRRRPSSDHTACRGIEPHCAGTPHLLTSTTHTVRQKARCVHKRVADARPRSQDTSDRGGHWFAQGPSKCCVLRYGSRRLPLCLL
ncbi:hypothetical protein OH76DRAFT_1399404 [Lentinus brumalis]|uniref:Secreted protein n=1 Tax=Lentinus brumalis TaxID=2498619 RepID=A0A371DLS6_9APHY|nr:hypothetical protein OH76DRAFT_1399404 [Polyporus brumalis]